MGTGSEVLKFWQDYNTIFLRQTNQPEVSFGIQKVEYFGVLVRRSKTAADFFLA